MAFGAPRSFRLESTPKEMALGVMNPLSASNQHLQALLLAGVVVPVLATIHSPTRYMSGQPAYHVPTNQTYPQFSFR